MFTKNIIYCIINLTTTIQKVLLLKSPLVFRRGYTRGLLYRRTTTMPKTENIIGRKFNKLTVLSNYGVDKSGHRLVKCKCECGNIIITTKTNLKLGRKKSCGCLFGEKVIKHNQCNTRLYQIWKAMIQRCTNPKQNNFKRYGEKGVKVCEEWLDNFTNFYYWSIANGYQDNLTIDRINVNGNYEPSNCRWTDMKTQQRNRRNNHLVTFNGDTKCLAEWAEIYKIPYKLLYDRLYDGWDFEKAITFRKEER